ncbi:MAG: hypothetical protein JWO13_841 [Acidobacteriales bacterium]|nr:hypothetical protein [Terriglobales bacterium]
MGAKRGTIRKMSAAFMRNQLNMSSVQTTLLLAVLAVLLSCDSRPICYYVSGVQVSRDGQISPVGSRLLVKPNSGSYYFFFHAAALTAITHMERSPANPEEHRSLYLETKPDGRLDRTVKSDVILVGDFGTISAQRTCFYNRPVQSNYSSVTISFNSNGYPSAFEIPTVLPRATEVIPPLTSVSLIRVIRNGADYTLISADYESTGELRGLHVVSANAGNTSPAKDVFALRLGSKDPRLEKYGVSSEFDIHRYLSLHRLHLPFISAPEHSVWLIQWYDFGKLIQQQQLQAGVPISTRWLQPSTTQQEQTIGPECDSRFRQQRSMGLPTTGY